MTLENGGTRRALPVAFGKWSTVYKRRACTCSRVASGVASDGRERLDTVNGFNPQKD